jgi:hypothetical protein
LQCIGIENFSIECQKLPFWGSVIGQSLGRASGVKQHHKQILKKFHAEKIYTKSNVVFFPRRFFVAFISAFICMVISKTAHKYLPKKLVNLKKLYLPTSLGAGTGYR